MREPVIMRWLTLIAIGIFAGLVGGHLFAVLRAPTHRGGMSALKIRAPS
jgi:hypothetical protein